MRTEDHQRETWHFKPHKGKIPGNITSNGMLEGRDDCGGGVPTFKPVDETLDAWLGNSATWVTWTVIVHHVYVKLCIFVNYILYLYMFFCYAQKKHIFLVHVIAFSSPRMHRRYGSPPELCIHTLLGFNFTKTLMCQEVLETLTLQCLTVIVGWFLYSLLIHFLFSLVGTVSLCLVTSWWWICWWDLSIPKRANKNPTEKLLFIGTPHLVGSFQYFLASL